MNDIKRKLLMEHLSYNAAAKFYNHVIENNQNSYLPNSEYMLNLINHQQKLMSQSEHSAVKVQSEKCLTCTKVLTCQVKCDEFNKNNN